MLFRLLREPSRACLRPGCLQCNGGTVLFEGLFYSVRMVEGIKSLGLLLDRDSKEEKKIVASSVDIVESKYAQSNRK